VNFPSDADLLQAYLDGELSPEDIAALETRLKAEPALADALLALAREETILIEWAGTTRAREEAERASAAAQERESAAPPLILSLPRSRAAAFARSRFLWASLPAAALLLAVLGMYAAWRWRGNEPDVLARIEEVQGDVSIIAPSGTIAIAQEGQPLLPGQELKTGGEGSLAVVRYADQTRLTLNTETLIRLLAGDKSAQGKKAAGKKVFLREGVLAADVARQPEGNPMVLTTPHAEVQLSDTQFRSTAASEETRIEMDAGRGKVTRTSDRQSVEMQAGSYVVTAPKDEPLAPRKLPAQVTKPKVILKDNAAPVAAVAATPDGKTLAIAGTDGVIKLWDVTRRQVQTTLKGLEPNVQGLAFAHDGKVLAGVSDKAVRLWDLTTGQELRTLQANKFKFTSAAFSPDGKVLATGCRDRTVRLWRIDTGELLATLKGHRGAVLAVAYSPDGKTLAAAGGQGKEFGETILWDVATRAKQATLLGHGRVVRTVAFAPDGRTVATAGQDNKIMLWDAATGEERLTLNGHVRPVNAVAFSPDGFTLASASNDNTIKLWDVVSGKEQRTYRTNKHGPSCVGFTPDGKTLVSGGRDRTVRLWDATGKDGNADSLLL
jgi:WD40 repeat protein